MLTGPLRNDIDKLWEKFWTGGITNPLTVIEQISYLMFARLLDMQEATNERKAARSGKAFKRHFPEDKGSQLLRWQNFKNMSGAEMRPHLRDKVYPHFANIHMGEGDIAEFMRDAEMEIKNESVLTSAIEMVDKLPLTDQDSLNKSFKDQYPNQEQEAFDIVLANPPFKGSLDESSTNPDVLKMVKTKKTELLFVAQILRMLKLGGRSATIVPDGVLFGSSKAHQQLRKTLIEENQLEAIVSLPSGVFKPYAGVSTAILFFTKGGTTEQVWFYDLQADGRSLDDKRNALVDEKQLGALPEMPLNDEEHAKNNLPDCLKQWRRFQKLTQAKNEMAEVFQDRTQQAFIVPASEIAANKYDLSINRYKEVVYEEEQYEAPLDILAKMRRLEDEIIQDMDELNTMLQK